MISTNTNGGINFLNSIEVAKMLGVNVSTVKRWTDDGNLACNRTIGGHRKFLMAHLVDFVEKNKGLNPKVEVFSLEDATDLQISYNIIKRNFDELIKFTTDYALGGERDRVLRILNGLYLSQYSLHSIFDDLVTPVMHNLGDLWEEKKLGIIEEHIATQTMKDSIIRLQGITKLGREFNCRALLMNLSSELHDLGLKMVDHILEERGFDVYFSGQITPVDMAETVFEKYRPNRLYISSTYVEDKKGAQDEISKLFRIAKKFNTGIYVGGPGFNFMRLPKAFEVTVLETFQDVFEK